ncbi:hypothetical protein JCM8547_004033 [Rhodosporidiobolus lusitaniae]
MAVKLLLLQANALLGLSPTPSAPPRLAQPKPSLSSVLAARLASCRSLASPSPSDAQPTPPDDFTEQQLQCLTAAAALELLTKLAEVARQSTPPLPSASSSSAAPRSVPAPPVFGARDMKALGMLAGVVGRWGVQVEVDFLARSAPGGTGVREKKAPKIAEIDEEDEEKERKEQEERGIKRKDSRARLSSILQTLVDEVLRLAPGERTDGEKQFLGIVMPQPLGSLVAGLVELSAGLPGEGNVEDRAWAKFARDRVFRSNPPTVILSTLLTLLSSSRSPSSRAHLSALLSSQLLRPGGVRSLLIVVVGAGAPGGGAEGEDEVGGRKLEMLRRLMSSPPSSDVGEQKAYFTNLTSQLLALLHSGAVSSVSATLASASSASSTAKGKAPAAQKQAAQQNVHAVPVPILRAASYVLAHFLVAGSSATGGGVAEDVEVENSRDPLSRFAKPAVLAALHGPLLPLSYPPSSSPHTLLRNPSALLTHLTTLTLLLSLSPPLPSLLTTLLTPLLPPLFSLLSFLSHPPLIVSAPTPESAEVARQVKEEVGELLGTYGRGVGEVGEVVRGVCGAVERWERREEFGVVAREEARGEERGEGRGAEWKWADDGAPYLSFSSVTSPPPSILPSPSLLPDGDDGDDLDPSALSLRVDPQTLVRWLLDDVQRQDVTAGCFLRWLDEVKVLKDGGVGRIGGVEEGKRALTRLQLVLALVDPETGAGPEILTSPQEIVAFVAHALGEEEAAAAPSSGAKDGKKKEEKVRAGLAGLRIVEEDEEEKGEQEEDEGEEEGGLGTGFGKDEMAMTALTLLLAVLEANPDLNASNTPLLPVIASQLAYLSSSSPSHIIAPLAREAKMVLSLRSASSSFASSSSSSATANGKNQEDDPLEAFRETYRTALKLLQDPLLPVRAQGLHLLRTLVLSPSSSSPNLLKTDPALLPAVLDIFVLALEEEDSFLYLNAVQGLSSLVDVFGKQVIGRLMETYTGTRKGEERVKEVGKGEAGRRELDKRLRVGEALVQVVQRAGEALGVLAPTLLPPLLLTLRTATLPVPLRASSLTLLAVCVETAPTAMVQHAELLAEAATTLLQVESVPLRPKVKAAAAEEEEKTRAKGEKEKSKNEKDKGKGVLIEEVDSSSSSPDDDDEESTPPPPALGKDGRPRRPEELPDPTTTFSRHPTLRRSALIFLAALVRAVARQAAEQAELAERQMSRQGVSSAEGGLLGGVLRMPGQGSGGGGGGGGAFLMRERRKNTAEGYIGAEALVRARRVLRYASETDEDALVRHQAGEVLAELEE